MRNQDLWITDAISKELPATKHAFCIWQITAKFRGWFTSILRTQYSNRCMDFYKLYKLESCEEFDDQWLQVMTKYDMLSNKHVIGLYQIKHFWVPYYPCGLFLGWNDNNQKNGKYKCIFFKWFVSFYTDLIQLIK